MPTFSQLYSSALTIELGTADSTRLFTDARRKAAINDGIAEFADLTECYVRQSTISCSHAVAEYNLLSTVQVPGGDFLRVADKLPEYQHSDSAGVVSYISGESFERRDIAWLNQYEPGWRASTGGAPRFYYERADGGRRLLGLYPPPEVTSSQSARVILPYVASPPTLTTDTEAPFTNSTLGTRSDLVRFHQAAVHYGAYQLEKLRKNSEAGQQQLSLFLVYVERFRALMRPKGGQTMKQARSYLGEVRRRREDRLGAAAPWWLR